MNMEIEFKIFELVEKEIAPVPNGCHLRRVYEFKLMEPNWSQFFWNSFDTEEEAAAAIQKNQNPYEKYVIHKIYTSNT